MVLQVTDCWVEARNVTVCLCAYMFVYLCMPHIGIATAAIEMLAGDTAVKMSRKPDIVADAAYLILTGDSREVTGQFFIDDEVLKQHGITNMDQYANVPGQGLSTAIHTDVQLELYPHNHIWC